MTIEAERMCKCANENEEEGKEGEQEQEQEQEHFTLPAPPGSLKPCEKSPSGHRRKHFVPNSGLGGSSNHNNESTHWATKAFALTVILVSTWFLQQRSGHDDDAHPHSLGGDEGGICREIAIQAPRTLPCSGHGYMEHAADRSSVACRCYACYGGEDCSTVVDTCVIDLDHGDPTMFEEYWFQHGASSSTIISGWQRMSYFAQNKHVWFMEHELDHQIRAFHQLVGNAVTEGRHIVVGTGSTQLFQATLYALTSHDQPAPTSVVSAAPFYSSYPAVTDYLRSALFKWAGDANEFKPASDTEPYIELVTSPNNPDGRIQQAVVNGTGPVVYDLAYYWPHFTPITGPADHDIMLFTISKSTGHAGTRIGWAIVKDKSVATKMVKFIELNTIGVSQDSQVRATHILQAVVEGYGSSSSGQTSEKTMDHHHHHRLSKETLFHYGNAMMQYRWNRLRSAVAASSEFTLPEFVPSNCTFFKRETMPTPAFAWLRCNKVTDCQVFLKKRGIITRSGRYFGAGLEYVRLSMLERSQSFEFLVDRLAKMDSARTPD